MNRNAIIGFLGFALVIGLLIFFVDGSSKPGIQKNYYSNWKESYRVKNDNPRNISFFLELAQAHTKDSIHVIYHWNQLDSIPRKDEATYLYIGESMGMSNAQYDTLMNYADSGATMFWAFDYLTSNVYKKHFEPNAYYWDFNKNLYAWIGDTSLKFSYLYENDTLATDWYAFDEYAIKDTNYVAYAFAMNQPLAFYEKHHQGTVHFHAGPRLFENYQILSANGFAHANFILKRFPKNKPIVVLKFADYNASSTNLSNSNEQGEGGSKQDASYIQYILKNPALRLAFVLALILFVLYLLFRAKRRENVLEGVPSKQNMGLAFVETLSSIYISRNSPIGILQVMRKNFFTTVSRHYYVDLTRKEERDQMVDRLVERSNYDREKILEILNGFNTRNNDVNYQHLGVLYRNIRTFYETTGIQHPMKDFVTIDKEANIDRNILIGSFALIVSLLIFIRGMYMLTLGGGVGMLVVLPSIALIAFAARLLRLPVARITQEKLILYGLFLGKKEIPLNQTIHTETISSGVKFTSEDGNSFEIKKHLLSKNGKAVLANFVEYLKNQLS
jgi:hypothetical protein